MNIEDLPYYDDLLKRYDNEKDIFTDSFIIKYISNGRLSVFLENENEREDKLCTDTKRFKTIDVFVIISRATNFYPLPKIEIIYNPSINNSFINELYKYDDYQELLLVGIFIKEKYLSKIV